MVRRFLLLAVWMASPACLLGVPGLIDETEPVGCQAGDTMVCYTGEEGTQDQGICRAGAGLCNDDGEVDVCEGQVLPRVEVCRSDDGLDEDCDGEVNDHCALWSKSFGVSGEDRLVGLTTLGDSVIISGDYDTAIDFGGDELSTTNVGGFVARLDEDGEHVWSLDVSGAQSERAASVAVSAERVLVGGNFTGELNIGAFQHVAPDEVDRQLFVAALMPDDGAEDWVKVFGDTKESWANNVAVHGAGNTIGVGQFDGTITFGTQPQLTTAGGDDALIFALDPTGEPLWSKAGGAAGEDVARGVAVIGDMAYVSGWANEALDLGCSETIAADGDGDGFVAALDATDGACQWLLHLPCEGGQARARGLATDGIRLFVGVDFEGTLTLPDGETMTSAGDLDVAVFAMTPDREVLWSRQFGDDAKQDIFVAAADGEGGVLIGGAATGTPDLGEGTIVSQDVGEDAYVIRLDNVGQVLWARTFGGDGDDDTINAAFSEGGLLFIGGEVRVSMDLGAGLIEGQDIDVFVARIAP